MGLHDRPYWRDENNSGGSFGGTPMRGGMGIGLPKPPKAVKMLLVINLVVFVVQLLTTSPTGLGPMERWFGLSVDTFWQPWRYLTFQFLHSPTGLMHVALNMLGLYFLGTPLEQTWGTRRFVKFYLVCGVCAGVAYVTMGMIVPHESWKPLIGASGGVYGILLAAAVLFPHMRLIFFLFPVPIRLAAVIIFGGIFLVLLQSLRGGQFQPVFWSHVAHFGGAAAAAVWIWVLPRFQQAASDTRTRVNRGAWERKMRRLREEQEQIDAILEKIHTDGIQSLSEKERRILSDATRRQRDEEQHFRG